jgi:hypothetical protein
MRADPSKAMSCVVRPEAKSDGFPWLPDSGLPTPDEPRQQSPIWPSAVQEGLPRIPPEPRGEVLDHTTRLLRSSGYSCGCFMSRCEN